MNKQLTRGLLLTFIFSATAPAYAEQGWRLFAGTEDDFQFKPTLSLMTGAIDSDEIMPDAGMAYGIEASFACPLIQSPGNKIRQQISYMNYDEDNVTLHTVEANVHYRIAVSEKVKAGFGPGIGYVRSEIADKTTNMLAGQLGASLHYNYEKYFVGGEARYQFTQGSDVGAGNNGAENWRALLKVGYNFY